MRTPDTIPNEESLTLPQEMIIRLEKRKRDLWKGINPNPYYVKRQFPTEYQDILSKIKELKLITKNN